MKCPLKFRLYRFEGGDECDPECAWRLVTVRFDDGGEKAVEVCALSAMKIDGVLFGIANWDEPGNAEGGRL